MTQATSVADPAVATGTEERAAERPIEATHVRRSHGITVAAVLVALALMLAITNFVSTVTDYSKVFVHPEVFQFHLPQALRGGFSFGFHDAVDALQFREANESRPRWAAYFLQAIDLKLRLRLYQWMPLPPTFMPITWLIQFIVAPYLLYRLLSSMTGDRIAALAGLAVYVSGIGFLCGFTMSGLPGKSLSNTLYILAFFCAFQAVRWLRPGQLLVESKRMSKYLLLVVLLLGLFIDELPLASFFLIPLTFWPHFVPTSHWSTRLRPFVANAAFFAIPVAVFLVIVVVVMPPIIERIHGFTFDYLGSTLLINGNTRTGTSLVDGRFAKLTPSTVLNNVTTLFGLSLVPWQVSPLINLEYGEYPADQVTNAPKVVVLLAMLATVLFVAVRSRTSSTNYLRGFLLGLALFFLFLTGLSIRHIPIVTGYYYAAGYAALFAILVGLLFHNLSVMLPATRTVTALAVLAIVAIQADNFAPINAGWIYQHTEVMASDFVNRQLRPGLQRRMPLAPGRPLSPTEVSGIWAAWHRDRTDQYLREHRLAPAAVYEVMELRALDHLTRNDNDD